MAIRRSVATLALVLLASCGSNAPSPTPTAAQETASPVARATLAPALHISTFQSPTRNIGCQIVESSARCDTKVHSYTPPPKPADCDLEWGDAIELTESGPASFVCHGDTAFDTRSPVLAYGTRTRVGKIVCLSAKTGIICGLLQSRHSFSLSRARYRLA